MVDGAPRADRPSTSRRKWILILCGVVVVGILVYRARGLSFEWSQFADTFRGLHWPWLAASIVFTLLSFTMRAIRWEVMLRPARRGVSIRGLTYDTIIGFTGVVLLGRPGELVRPYLISARSGLPFSSQMAIWLLERILDLLAVVLIFGFTLLRIPSHGLQLGAGLKWVLETGGYLLTAIGAACVLFFVLFRNFSEPAQRRLLSAVTFLPEKQYQRVERTLAAFSEGMESTRDVRSLGLLGLYTALEWTIIIGIYATLLAAFPATSQMRITDVVIYLGFAAFGSLFQIPGIGGGVQVTSIVVLTQIFGLPLETSTGLSLFVWFFTFVVVVPFGLLCALHEGISWSKLKHLREDTPL